MTTSSTMARRALLLAIMLASTILTARATISAADPSPAATSAEAAERISAILRDADFSGAALVVRQGALLYRLAMGLADMEQGIENTPETRFKLASIDKQMLAGLVLTLVRDGLITLDGSLCQGIPDCPASLKDVTYHQVLTHTSGIPEISDEELAPIRSNEDALDVIGGADRLFAPGDGWGYSSTAYSLLTATTELLTGEGLIDLRRARVFEPAGMTRTGLDGFDGPPTGAAVGYDQPSGMPVGGPVGDWSTVDDLWAWHRSLSAAEPIPSALVEAMETPHAEVEPGLSYGYGVELRDTAGHREVSHRGGTAGFTGYLVRFPDDDSLIALLANVGSIDVDSLREQLIDVVLADT
jgi:CubicO group peptidase (beta-lactamase class C family)